MGCVRSNMPEHTTVCRDLASRLGDVDIAAGSLSCRRETNRRHGSFPAAMGEVRRALTVERGRRALRGDEVREHRVEERQAVGAGLGACQFWTETNFHSMFGVWHQADDVAALVGNSGDVIAGSVRVAA